MSTVAQLLTDALQQLRNLLRLRAVDRACHIFLVETVVYNPEIFVHLATRALHKLCLCKTRRYVGLCKHVLHLV